MKSLATLQWQGKVLSMGMGMSRNEAQMIFVATAARLHRSKVMTSFYAYSRSLAFCGSGGRTRAHARRLLVMDSQNVSVRAAAGSLRDRSAVQMAPDSA